MSALLNLALKGLKRTLENNEIIEPKIARKTKEEYQFDNNPVLQFIEDATDKDYRQLPVVEGVILIKHTKYIKYGVQIMAIIILISSIFLRNYRKLVIKQLATIQE